MKWLTILEKDALVDGDHRIGYRELSGLIAGGSKTLSALSVRGERVAILARNSSRWVVSLYSSWHSGAVVVPIDFMSTVEEIAYILDDCTPKAIWCDEENWEKAVAASRLARKASPEILRMEEIAVGDDGGVESYESPDADLALVIYTSGTTGYPKGVMLSFGNIHANTVSCSVHLKIFQPADRVMVILPLHHAYPLMASVVMPISIGATSIFVAELSGKAIVDALCENQGTFIIGVPRMVELFHNSIMGKIRASWLARALFRICGWCHSMRLSRFVFRKVQNAMGGHIRFIACGGAAVSAEVIRDFMTLGFNLIEGYGMTETGPMISFTPPGKWKRGSVGVPLPGTEVQIVQDEVCVRGANVTRGYFGNAEETQKTIDADGWLHTGDTGRVDEDGYIFLTGRTKELIILGNGKNISPVELEEKLMKFSCGLISECAVVQDAQHLGVIVVPDLKEIARHRIVNIHETLVDRILEPFNESEPSYKRIARMVLSEEPLPRTRLGKLRRHILLEQLADPTGHASKGRKTPVKDEPTNECYGAVRKCLEEITGRSVGPDEHFELDLELDSLAKTSLVSELSIRCQRDVPIELLAGHPTARALSQAMEALPQDGPMEASEIELPKSGWEHGALRVLTKVVLGCLEKLDIQGKENIPDGPCVIAPNHQSSLDPFVVACALSRNTFKRTYFYAISKLFRGRLMNWLAKRHNIVQMEINGDLRKSIGMLRDLLKAGKSVVIFPEGTRSMDGSVGAFHPTFARLAKETGVPVVPVCIQGAYEALPRGKSLPRIGRRIAVKVLPAIDSEKTTLGGICIKTRKSIVKTIRGAQKTKRAKRKSVWRFLSRDKRAC